MNCEVVSSYLRVKFSSTLNEAEADLGSSLPILSRFRAVERLINTISDVNNSSTMADHLYSLMDVLTECTIFAQERRKEAASKKGFYLFRLFLFEKNMKRKVDEIEKNMKRQVDEIEKNTTVGPPQDGTGTGELKIEQSYPSLIVGFESQVSEIENLLMPIDSSIHQFKAIGIVGRCGSGKTALTQKVFSSPKIEEKFSPRIWVCLSDLLLEKERSDLRVTILNQILRETGQDDSDLEYGDHSMVQLLEKLQLRLMGKRYLIVLDDAWRMDEWFADLGSIAGQAGAESFTHGLPKGSGGAVIVTSRGEDVIRRMVGKEEHVIRPQLSDETCWKIFWDAVEQQGKIRQDDYPTLIKMQACITKNCEGLPLAAQTLANLIPNLLEERVIERREKWRQKWREIFVRVRAMIDQKKKRRNTFWGRPVEHLIDQDKEKAQHFLVRKREKFPPPMLLERVNRNT